MASRKWLLRDRDGKTALWAVALAMGLRRGEGLGLAWRDIDLDQGRLTVRQALHQVDGPLQLDSVKTDASVAVQPIPAPLISILGAHRHRQREERIAAGSRWRDTSGWHCAARRHRAVQW